MIINGLRVVSRVAAAAATNRQLVRSVQSGILCTPPRERVSFTEKVIHGFVMLAAVMAIPTYIQYNVKSYRKPEEEF